jgi:hypothetical protein
MGHTWVKTRWLGAMVLALAGCTSTQPDLKPPKQPEQLAVPPDDPRYNNYTQYPKDTLNTDLNKKPDAGPLSPSGGKMGGMTPGMGH